MEITNEEYNHLLKLAYHDKLTDCYNRNWYYDNYSDDSEFKFVMIDVNHLKQINDNLGHTAGDKMICDVSSKLKSFGDVIRFGGDEFILIVPMEFDVHKLNDKRYSYGWEIKTKSKSLSECLEIADEYMYKAKRRKENRHGEQN